MDKSSVIVKLLIHGPIQSQTRWEKAMQRDSKNHGEECDALVSHSGAARFNVGNDVAAYVTPKQLHPGGKKFLRPACLIPKFGDISSDDIGISGHTISN
jgi:hypothetical protein